MEKLVYRGLGRRKSSSARVILKAGNGEFKINNREAKEYLRSDILIKDALQPLELIQEIGK